MDKLTILHNVTKTFQAVMDFFNKHEAQLDKMTTDLEQEVAAKSLPEASDAKSTLEVSDDPK